MAGVGTPGRAAGIAAPFQMAALDDVGAGNLTARPVLPLRPGAGEDHAAWHGRQGPRGVEPYQARPCPGQQVVNGVRGCVRKSAETWRPGHCPGPGSLRWVESGPACPRGRARVTPVSCVTSSDAIRSAIMMVGMWVLADGMSGMMDASATVRPPVTWTLPAASTTAPAAGSEPMAQVPAGWW